MLCKVVAVLTFFIFHLGVAEDSTTSGLIVETLVMPDECTKTAEKGDLLKIEYIGRVNDAHGKIFEMTGLGNVYEFTLGAGKLIQGYEQGVPGMCLGEKRALTIPPELAYGHEFESDSIPKGSNLHFTVTLVDIVKKEELAQKEARDEGREEKDEL